MLASRGECEVLVARLVEQGALLDRRDREERTALMFSVWTGEWGRWSLVWLLLDKGADHMIMSCDGQRAADIDVSSATIAVCARKESIDRFC